MYSSLLSKYPNDVNIQKLQGGCISVYVCRCAAYEAMLVNLLGDEHLSRAQHPNLVWAEA